MPFVESISEFAARMGCTPLQVRGRYLFPNGAQSDGHNHVEPPTDSTALAVLRYEYVQTKLIAAIENYNGHRNGILQQAEIHAAGAGPAPERGWEQFLQRLATEIEQMQATLAELRAQLPTTKNDYDYNRVRAEQRQTAAAVASKIRELPVF